MPPVADEPQENDGFKILVVKWVFQQSVPTALLFAILVSGWYGGSYVVREAIPNHLKSIRDGYESIEASHRAERDERIKTFSADREKDRELMREFIFQGIKKSSATYPGDP